MRFLAQWLASTYVLCTSVILLFVGMLAMVLVLFGMMGTEQRDWIWQYAIAGEVLLGLGVALAYAVFRQDYPQQEPQQWQMPEDFEMYYQWAEQELQHLSTGEGQHAS